MLIEVHMLKNYPPTNLNRDDSGAPKTCMFAGTTRGRVSSQCLKRSWRTSPLFVDAVGKANIGIRTREMPELVCDELKGRGVNPEWLEIIEPTLTALVGKANKKGNYTSQVVFYSPEDISAVADGVEKVLGECHDKKAVKGLKIGDIEKALSDARTRPVTVDIALFGRMVTSDSFADVEASMQVAHAISTNIVYLESDFFTAVDDIVSGNDIEERGSAMMGDTDYDSSCYYLYASLDTDALRKNLSNARDVDELVRTTVPTLLRTMMFTNPSGKQNTFAGHVLPSAVLVEAKRERIPVSLVNAFAEPARADARGDLILHSIEKLAGEADRTQRQYQIPTQGRWWFASDRYESHPETAVTACKTVEELITGVTTCLEEAANA